MRTVTRPLFVITVGLLAVAGCGGDAEPEGTPLAAEVTTIVDTSSAATGDNDLKTTLGAIAIDGTVWLSNPVTGTFEALPPGYDLDPSTSFDPQDGWRPLVADLQDQTFVGENRGGKRYPIHGSAPAERMEAIPAGLVKAQDVPIDLWLRRDTGLVTAAEFSTAFDGGVTDWVLELSNYGDTFTIEPLDIK